MMPQGDTESKKSMGDSVCSIIVLLSAESLWPKKDMKVMYCCKQGTVADKYFLCSLQKQVPILQVDLWKP